VRYPATVTAQQPSVSVRIPFAAKQDLDQLTIQLASDLGRRVTLPETVAAMVATAKRQDLAKYLRD